MLLYFLSAINFLSHEEKKIYQKKFFTLEELNNQLKNLSLEKKYHQLEQKEYLIHLSSKYSRWDLAKILLGNNEHSELLTKILPDKPVQELSVSYNDFFLKKSFSEIFPYIFSKESLKNIPQNSAEGDFLLVSQVAPYLYQVHQKVNIFNKNIQIIEELSSPLKNSFFTTEEKQHYQYVQNTLIQSVDPSKQSFQTGDLIRIDSTHFSPCLFFKGICVGKLEYVSPLESGSLAMIKEICPNINKTIPDLINFTPVGTRQEYCSLDCVKIKKELTLVETPFKKKLYTEKIPVDYETEVLISANLDKYEEDNKEDKYFPSISLDDYEKELNKLYIDPPPLIAENPFGITPSIIEESLELLNRVY